MFDRIAAFAGRVTGLRTLGSALLGAAVIGAAASAQTFTVGTPTITAVSSDPTTATAGGEIDITFTVSDPSGNVFDVELDLSSANPGPDLRLSGFETTCTVNEFQTVNPSIGSTTARWQQLFGTSCDVTFRAIIDSGASNGVYTLDGPTGIDDNNDTSTGGTSNFTIGDDSAGPIVTITPAQGSAEVGETFTVNIAFNEAVDNFDASDISLNDGVVSNFLANSTDLGVLSASFETAATTTGTLTVTIPAAALTDAAGNTNAVASADVTINAATVSPVTAALSVVGNPLDAGDTGTLRLELSNSDASAQNITFFTASLSNALTGLVVQLPTTTDTCTGTPSGTSFLIYTGGSVPGSGSCVIEFPLVVPAGAANGSYTITTSAIVTSGGNTDPVSADLIVGGIEGVSTPIAFTKSFLTNPVADGGATVLEYTIRAAPGTSASSLAFTDDFEFVDGTNAPRLNLAPSDLPKSNVCGSGSLLSASGNGLSLSGGNLSTDGSCTFNVTLTPDVISTDFTATSTTSDISGNQNDGGGDTPVTAGVSASAGITGLDSAPTVTVTSSTTSYDPVGTFTLGVEFSESVSDFVVGDITISEATLSDFAGSGTTYSATVTPTGTAPIQFSVAAGAATGDTSGETNVVSNTVTVGSSAGGFSFPVLAVQESVAARDIPAGDTTPSTVEGTNFGEVAPASGAAVRTFVINNTGSAPAVITSITVDDTTNYTIGSVPTEQIASGSGTASFTLTYDPQSAGPHVATVSINLDTSSLNAAVLGFVPNPYTFDVTGQLGTEGEIAISGNSTAIALGDATPASADGTDFGTTTLGTPDTATFSIENVGAGVLTLGSDAVSIESDTFSAFSVSSQPATTVSASGSESFTIEFDPPNAGIFTANVSIASDDRDENPYTFGIRAEATGVPEVVLEGSSLEILAGDATPASADGTDLGSVQQGSTASSTFTIRNSGTVNLSLSSPSGARDTIVERSSGSTAFTVSAQPGSTVLAGSETTTFTIQYAPTSDGAESAVFSFASTDADESPYTFTVSGTGTSPEINLVGADNTTAIPNGDSTPNAAKGTDFFDVGVSTGSETVTLTIENTGTGLLTLGANAVSSNVPSEFSVTDQPDTTVAAGGSTTFEITFNPSALLLRSALISIANDDADESPYTFIIQGSGSDDIAPTGYSVAFDPAAIIPSNQSSVSFTFTGAEVGAGYDYSISSSGGGTPVTGSGTIATSGDQITGIDVTSLPDGTLTLSATLTDANSNEGAAANDTVAKGTIPPGFTKSFSPTAILVGGTSTLTFSIDNTTSAVAASSLDFTDNFPAGMTVDATPNASTTCTGGTLTAVGGAGTVSYSGGSVAAGGSCTISVDVTSTTNGGSVNTSGDLTSNLGNSGTATDTLTVSSPSLSIDDVTVGEADGVATFTVTLSAAPASAVSVDYATTTGTAAAGTDFTTTSGTLNFAVGDTTETFTVAINDDAIDEADEDFTVTLSNPTNATITDDEGTGTITDNDDTPIVFVSDAEANEGDGTMTFQAFLAQPGFVGVGVTRSSFDVTFEFATADAGDALAGVDYTAVSGTFTVPAGDVGVEISVPIIDDALDEENELFSFVMANATNATIGAPGGIGTIRDNDDAPTVTVANTSVFEDAGTVTFEVNLSAPSSKTVSVDLATTPRALVFIPSIAFEGEDFVAKSETITFAPGETQKTFVVSIIDDPNDEPLEQLYVDVTNAINATIDTPSPNAAIRDNDDPPTVSVTSVTVDESAGTALITVAPDNPSGFTTSISVASADGTATGGSDYLPVSFSLQFNPYEASKSFNIQIFEDALSEADETFDVTLLNASGLTAGPPGVVTITDNDVAPSLSIDDVTVAENTGTATFTVSLSAASGQAVSVDFATAAGTATAGSDFTANSGTLNFAAGDTSETISVLISDDSLDELDEGFSVALSSAVNANISDSLGVGTITDNDSAPNLSIADVTVDEGDGTATFTVSLDAASGQDVGFVYQTSDGTALDGSDYTNSNGPASIVAGNTSTTFTVPITDDALDEADETFTVDLSSVSNATVSDGSATATITDNDAAPGILIGGNRVDEGDGSVTLTVSLDAISTQTVSVVAATSDSTAEAGSDYTANSETITFAPGEQVKSFTVAILDDVLDEPQEEFFSVTLSSPTNGTIFSGSAAVIIDDNDDGPAISISDVTIAENAGTAAFTVSLDAASAQAISVDFATADGTASAPGDYTSNSGTLNFAAGETSQTVTVTIIDDGVVEPDETFTVDLSNPTNATVAESQGLGTIANDDAAPTGFSVAFTTDPVNVNNQTSVSALLSNGPVGGTFAYTVTSSGGGTDVTGNGSISSASESFSFDVSGLNDGTLTINLTPSDSSGNEGVAVTDTATKETVQPGATVATSATDPVNGTFEVTVTFTEAVSGFALSDFNVSNGTASDLRMGGGGTLFAANITPTADGEVTVQVDADVAQDSNGNGNTASNTLSIDADGTAPVPTITTAAADPVSGAFTITVTFSEDVTGFVISDLSVGNGTPSNFAGSGDTYTATITPGSDGTVTVDIPAGLAQDSAGNNNVAATQFSIESDGTAPTVTLATSDSEPIASSFTLTVTFSEDVTGFVGTDLVVSNGVVGSISGSGSVYTAQIFVDGTGSVTVDVAAGAAQDAAGNDNVAATQFSIEADQTPPSVVISSTASDPVAGVFVATITFSEDVTGLEIGDFSAGNADLDNLSGSGSVYTVEVTPFQDGTVTLDLGAGVAEDAAGNGNTASNTFTIEADGNAPTVAITSSATSPVSGAFSVTVTFSEDVTGFALADLNVGNGTASNLAGSGDTYTATITPTGGGTVTVDIAAGVAQDAAGNDNTAATQFSIEIDGTAPDVTITTASSDPVSGTFTITVSFTEDVTGFALADLDVGNGAASDFAGSGDTYTATITPTADGTVTVDVAAGVAQDAAGNDNTAATQFSIESDGTPPSVAFGTAVAQSDPVAGLFTLSVQFSEDVTGFTEDDLSVSNAMISGFRDWPEFTSGSGFLLELTPTSDGLVTADVSADAAFDAAGNGNTAATQFSITADLTAPEATISTVSADPVSGAFSISVNFSEDVTGFTVDDLDVDNGSASDFAGSGDSYTATITPSADGTVTVDIAADAAQDDAGNGNTAADQFSIENDETPPSVTLAQATNSLANGGTLPGALLLEVTFSEDVNAFALDDFTVGNGTASDLTGSGSSYTVTITPTSDGTVTIDIAQDVAFDAAGNGNTAAETFSFESDMTVPVVQSLVVSDTDLRLGDVGDEFTLTVTFSEPVFDFGAGVVAFDTDLSATLSTTDGALSADGTSWVLTATILDGGQSIDDVEVSVSGFVDIAGNALQEFEQSEVFAVEMRRAGLLVSVEIDGLTDGTFDFTGDLGDFDITTVSQTGEALFEDLAEGDYTFTLGTLSGFSIDQISCSGIENSTNVEAGSATVTLTPDADAECLFDLVADADVNPEQVVEVPITLPANFTDPSSVSATFPLQNVGGEDLIYEITVDVPWLTVTPNSGTIPAGGTVEFTAAFTDAVLELEPGTYTATISFFNLTPSGAGPDGLSGGANTDPILIPVTIEIVERFGTLTLVATTPSGPSGEASFGYTSDFGGVDGATLTTIAGNAQLGPLDIERGAYTITQSLPEGWRLDTISCAGDTDGGSTIDVSTGVLNLDVDPEEALVCTFANVRDEDFVRQITTTAIRDFMAQRADQILSNSPRLSDRLRRGRSAARTGFAADFTEGRFNTEFATSLSAMRAAGREGDPYAQEEEQNYAGFDLANASAPGVLDVWVQATYSSVTDNRAGLNSSNRFGLAYIGADLMVSEDLLIGGLVQFDRMETTTGALRSEVEGDGWLAGPYAAWRLSENLYFDGRAAWGRSDNTINPLGLYSDDFETDRWLLEANLVGDIHSGGWRISPTLGVAWFDEESEAYIDTLGIDIPSQSVNIGRVRFEPEFAYRFDNGNDGYFEPYARFSANYDFDEAEIINAGGALQGMGDFRLDGRLGFNAQFFNGAQLAAEVSLNGIGESEFEASTAMIRLRTPLSMGR